MSLENASHVPSCYCKLCKPISAEPPLGSNEKWKCSVLVTFTVAARDYYTAREIAHQLAAQYTVGPVIEVNADAPVVSALVSAQVALVKRLTP